MATDSFSFEPKIIAFLCNWCAYGAADLAGVGRLQYPANIRTVRVMCSATVSPHFLLRALQSGADGILVGGWHIGDCHYLYGNHLTVKRVTFLQELLTFMGLGGRLHLAWISSAEAQKFARVVTDFTDHIRGLGPNPLKALERPRGGQPHGDAIGERAQSYALAGREMERV